jgi:hypothetical protein
MAKERWHQPNHLGKYGHNAKIHAHVHVFYYTLINSISHILMLFKLREVHEN